MLLNNVKNVKLGVIGCGKMANAILSGVINNKYIQNNNIYVFDVNEENAKNLSDNFSLNISYSIEELFKNVDVVLLATKPFVVEDVLSEIKKCYNAQLIMSILAGVKIEKYKKIIPSVNIVRVMPNTPSLVNCAMSAICCDNVDKEKLDFVFNFMKNCGEVIITTEDKMNTITALSGSGPAYYYKIIDLLAQSASKLGLNYKEALLLSSQTALGSAKMVMENDFDINQLIKNVTTPKGCTEVGNNVLNNSNISEIFDKLIKDTAQKAKELG